jgi:hypothetical protein
MRTAAEFEQTLRSVSAHETGHTIVAWHFDIAAVPCLPLDEDGDFLEFATSERESRGTDFEQSCIGWGGIIAQTLTDNPSPWMEEKLPWKLTEENSEAWHWTVLKEFECLSRGDQGCIQSYFDVLKSCRFAYRILSEHSEQLKRLSAELSEHTRRQRSLIVTARLQAEVAAEARRWEGVPRPELPASADTFIELVAGDKDRFQKFLVHRARLHLTNGRTGDRAELHALFNGTYETEFARALTLQRDIYRNFNGESWLSAVQHFRRFEAEQPTNQT